MVSDYSFLSWELLSSWLMTYALHSTIWLGGLAIVLRCTRVQSFAVRELCWRVAMPLGFATAMLALTLDSGFRMNVADFRLSAARVPTLMVHSSAKDIKPLPTSDSRTAEAVKDPVSAPGRAVAKLIPIDGTHDVTQATIVGAKAATSAVSSPLTVREAADASGSSLSDISVSRSNVKLSQIACIAWLCVCACCFMRWMMSIWGLHHWLKRSHRDELLDELLQNLGNRVPIGRQASVVVLDAAQPFTVGWLRPTIVIPQRALRELSKDQLLALLSHELGHVQFGHALWLHVLNLVCQLGFFQPLNFWAYRCWRREAELVADGWATSHCVGPKQLASCLLQVATWQIMPRGAGMLQFIGRRRDALVERVECLVGQTRESTKLQFGLTARASWVITCAAVGLALLGPKFSTASPTMAKDGSLSLQTQAAWLSVQQEWLGLHNDILVLSRIAKEDAAPQSSEQIAALLKQFEQIDRHYQEVQHTIDQEVRP